jgi:hypothetical protein
MADVHNEAQSGHPSDITKDLKDIAEAHIHESRRFATDEPHKVFPFLLHSDSYKIITVKL